MDRLTANRYISLQQKIENSGGGVPQELVDEVNALDVTVNGDETQDPPIVGLVDIVGDLESSVEDLDTTVNGDSTTTPATPGLVDRVGALETAMGTAGKFTVLYENSDSTQPMDHEDTIQFSSGNYDLLLWIFRRKTANPDYLSVTVAKGMGVSPVAVAYVSNAVTVVNRGLYRSSDTLYTMDDCKSATDVTANDCLIPDIVYGITF